MDSLPWALCRLIEKDVPLPMGPRHESAVGRSPLRASPASAPPEAILRAKSSNSCAVLRSPGATISAWFTSRWALSEGSLSHQCNCPNCAALISSPASNFSSPKGSARLNMMYATVPALHMSDGGPHKPSQVSGPMYTGVPALGNLMTLRTSASDSGFDGRIHDKPKSNNFSGGSARPLSMGQAKAKFSGFTSRCTMPTSACKYCNADSNCVSNLPAVLSGTAFTRAQR
mmetsp:Transcript_20548/g.61540  ORF Transcript_20548/g.61540 Transcript_20548/m.61540 type:complete len:229 (-) Transcript_20548:564-1250(-)